MLAGVKTAEYRGNNYHPVGTDGTGGRTSFVKETFLPESNDEISEIPHELQPKLLHGLQEQVMSARYDERLAERARLARELHDTLLQTIQGSKMIVDAALEQSGNPSQMRRAMEQLSVWLEQANEEGRAALNSMRTSTTETNDLTEALRWVTEACTLRENGEVAFSVSGETRDMHLIVRDEIYRIGYEAIRNACQHSEATRLEVELRYAQDFSVRVKDNGVGIDPVIASKGREGHFGLIGMRERAAGIGAKLTIVSSANSGTEIKLVVPGGLVFR